MAISGEKAFIVTATMLAPTLILGAVWGKQVTAFRAGEPELAFTPEEALAIVTLWFCLFAYGLNRLSRMK